MHLANYLGYLRRAELDLAEGFRKVADGHAEEADGLKTSDVVSTGGSWTVLARRRGTPSTPACSSSRCTP